MTSRDLSSVLVTNSGNIVMLSFFTPPENFNSSIFQKGEISLSHSIKRPAVSSTDRQDKSFAHIAVLPNGFSLVSFFDFITNLVFLQYIPKSPQNSDGNSLCHAAGKNASHVQDISYPGKIFSGSCLPKCHKELHDPSQ